MAVEFDAYENVDACDDPNGNHVSVQVGGSANTAASIGYAAAGLPQLRRLGGWVCRVAYIAKEKTLIVQLKEADHKQKEFETVLRVDGFVLEERMMLLNGKRAFIGFTAATGGLAQEHEVSECTVSVPDD